MIKLGFILTVVATVVIISSEVTDNDGKVMQRLNEKNIYPKRILISYQDSLNISVVLVGDSTKNTLVLVHGSPGDWSAWENIIANDSIRDKYYIIAVDRAGYGDTSVPPLADLSDQADVVWSALEELGKVEKVVLAGHSYGGAVIEQLMIEQKENIDLGVFVAATLSPELMEPRWYNKVAKWKFVNFMLSKDMKASNIEMIGLAQSLKENENKIAAITSPIILIQGKVDILVPFETVDYFRQHKPNGVSYITIEDMNHFIPWSDPYLITDALLGKEDKY